MYPEPSWYCPRCGHQNQLSFKHCTECGTGLPLGAVTSAQVLPQTGMTPEAKAKAEKGHVKIFLIAFGSIGLLVILMAAINEFKRSPAPTVRVTSLAASPSAAGLPFPSSTP